MHYCEREAQTNKGVLFSQQTNCFVTHTSEQMYIKSNYRKRFYVGNNNNHLGLTRQMSNDVFFT